MRRLVWISVFAFAATAAFAAAGSKESAKVQIPYEATWAGKTLPAGEYTFQWQGEGQQMDVTVLRGRQVVASGQGRLEELSAKAPYNAVVARPQEDGPRALSKIHFGGKTTVLVLEES